MLLAVGAVAFGLAFLELLYYSGTVGKRSYRRQTFCQAFKEELKTALGGSRGENSDSAPSPGVSGNSFSRPRHSHRLVECRVSCLILGILSPRRFLRLLMNVLNPNF